MTCNVIPSCFRPAAVVLPHEVKRDTGAENIFNHLISFYKIEGSRKQ